MTAHTFIVRQQELSSVRLPNDGTLHRNPPRPKHLRQQGYEDTFDFHTVFYDCFRLSDGTIRFAGPPLFNLRHPLLKSTLSLGQSKLDIADPELCNLVAMKRTSRLDIPDRDGAQSFTLTLPNQQIFSGAIGENMAAHYRGRRTLLTMVKYDTLEWIPQWVEFFVKAHGIDAVLIYNNNSPVFTSEDIVAVLKPIAGLKTIGVTDWYFPYGPGAGTSGLWDSAFCQVGAMEHARFRFLEDAACVINADVDELVFSDCPTVSLCQLAETSKNGYVNYRQLWSGRANGPDTSVPPAERLYRDTFHTNHTMTEYNGKWAVVPHRCPPTLEWRVHIINGLGNDKAKANRIHARHLAEFNSGWKSHRSCGGHYTQDDLMLMTYRAIGWS